MLPLVENEPNSPVSSSVDCIFFNMSSADNESSVDLSMSAINFPVKFSWSGFNSFSIPVCACGKNSLDSSALALSVFPDLNGPMLSDAFQRVSFP